MAAIFLELHLELMNFSFEIKDALKNNQEIGMRNFICSYQYLSKPFK
jgi:hypothetical protein